MREAEWEDRVVLASTLVSYYTQAGRDSDAIDLIDEMIKRDTDDVLFPIRRACQYLYFIGDLEEALLSIDRALERAYRTGFFRREALGMKARILLKLVRGKELTRVLEDIMALKMIKGVPDVGRERDFVDSAPPGMIPKHVLARYNQFRPSRPDDDVADEPPEWTGQEEA